MVKILLFSFFILICLASCNEKIESKENVNAEAAKTTAVSSEVQALNYTVQIFMVDSLNPKSGFGYNVLIDNKIFVHQPSIPSMSGNKTFDTKEKAELVANLVAMKLKNNIMPPSISKEELDSLQILN